MFEFVGNDSNTAAQPTPISLASTATSLIANQSNIPIFTSIFSYYESKSPGELGNWKDSHFVEWVCKKSEIHFVYLKHASIYEFLFFNFKANFIQMPRGNGQLQLRSNTRTRKKTLAWMHGIKILWYQCNSFLKSYLLT